LDEPASSAAFDRISENSLSVYLFEASLKGELHADKEDALASSQRSSSAAKAYHKTRRRRVPWRLEVVGYHWSSNWP
jgi:hypothetical protein